MSVIVDQYGQPFRKEVRASDPNDRRRLVNLQAAYDAAKDGGRNDEHWKEADGLSAAAANSPSVRKKMRERARYEYSNNSFARGLNWTLALDLIGTNVRIQFDASVGKRLKALLDERVTKWFKAIRLSRKLRMARIARGVDGEAFFLRTYSPRLKNKVKTTLRFVECDHFDDPMGMEEPNYVGGVRIDPRDGEPMTYTMMKQHPGDAYGGWNLETSDIDVDDLFHWHRHERGGIRSVTEMCSSLSLYGQTRRYGLASLNAAETVAAISGYLETQGMPMDDETGAPDYDRDVEAFDTLAIEHGLIMNLPRGHKFAQAKAEHPTTTFAEFRNANIDEAAAGQQTPAGKSRGDYSQFNYASGRLSNQGYYEFQDVERQDLADEGLDKILGWYFEDARLAYPEFADIDPEDLPDHTYFFDGHPHVDEVKHATATTMFVDSELLSEDDYLMSQGVDPDTHWTKIEEQRKRRAKLDAIAPGPKTPPPAPAAKPQTEEDESDSTGDDANDDEADTQRSE